MSARENVGPKNRLWLKSAPVLLSVSAFSLDSGFRDCRAFCFCYDEDWARTCFCLYSVDPARLFIEASERCSREAIVKKI